MHHMKIKHKIESEQIDIRAQLTLIKSKRKHKIWGQT